MMAAASAAQGALGVGQKIQAALMRRRAEREFDDYQIPASARAALEKAASVATMRGLPGEDLARARTMSGVAQGVEAARRTAESPNDVLSVLGRLYGGYAGFETNIASQGEAAYERRQGQLMSALDRFAGYETERWQHNELYPYMQRMTAAGQIDAAGGENVSGALNSFMNIQGTKWDIQTQQNQFNDWKAWQLESMEKQAELNKQNNAAAIVPNRFAAGYNASAVAPQPPAYYTSWTPYGR